MTLWMSGGGLACPVGHSLRAALAAMTAGVPRLAVLPYLDDDGQPVIGASLSAFPAQLTHGERLLGLACAAIEDCLSSSPGLVCEQTALLLVTSNEPRGAGDWDPRALAGGIASTLGRRFAALGGGLLRGGSAGIAPALDHARTLLADGTVAGVLICAVDSLVNASTLAWLHRSRRLRTPRFSDGISPGEAAGCLWLTAARQGSDPPQCEVRGWGEAMEHATVLNDEPFRGDGLAGAIERALSHGGTSLGAIALRISDLGGESYEFEEQSLITSRLLREPRVPLPLWHPAELIGTTGAAGGVIACLWAAHALAHGRVNGEAVLCCAGNADGKRAAVVLAARIERSTAPHEAARAWAL